MCIIKRSRRSRRRSDNNISAPTEELGVTLAAKHERKAYLQNGWLSQMKETM